MIIHFREDDWRPTERTGFRRAAKLSAGELVIWERRAHRVVETRERDLTDWPERYREKWVEWGMPDPATWDYRPFVVVLRPDDQPAAKPTHLLRPANHTWRTLPEHYAVCRLCAEIPPCRHVHNETIAERAAERFEQEMAILPGCCHACREPITRRQKSVRFTGPNLIRPDLGDDSAVFHLRAKCHGSVRAYDERWAKAVGKPRRFFCEGTMTVHQGGSTDCTELADCPGEVDHRARIWHHPDGARHGKYSGCWCLAGVIAS
ncbi:hypothetical protein RVR_8278 [Actinacidiphila reveromycinica]|uniref:Uncharacterized protein n=1 Tax=Actinacidiphila reveromycinica TaxID=659352 RepID=A0A7U3UYQ7_9ACTN|nr:hypothetical protein [Streptomyces sp. SN-593]BBB01044.1 hypothetical protein RVR_8278 [Streptomyces sp. SN-593]